ncbi:unnamed protein product [Fraxinus pennsylvanica]|uniref:Uncharacterized protein n=1 Tax=Fraxinus pennsylvanica TaxID=56036 RepID=A0AAD2E0V9_9LAMI|nr:unnamed protein product [Fraxinus pennsylvanica]
MVGQKRGIVGDEEMTAISYRRVKMRDLESFLPSETRGRWESDAAHPVVHFAPCELDLNTNVSCVSNAVHDDPQGCIEESKKQPTSGNEQMECNDDFSKSGGFKLDLNAENISSSINHDPFYPYKTYEHSKSRDSSECGSSVGPLEGKDPMGVWNKMKQKGYLSTSHGAPALAMPKPRVRKTKNDMMKKKIELAKKEQVDRFAKVAAPSGLLNGLNPGIINHVRNSRQVHSIIEALVRSERSENRHSESKLDKLTKCSAKEFSDKEDPEKTNCLGVNKLPCLMSREFPSNQENDLYTIGFNFFRPDKATANAHFVRWRTMFRHMDKALSEEESQLVSF